MAGDTIFLQGHAMTVVVNISSAMPFAILPITLAEAGATRTTSARFASATCSTLYWKLRSKVSTRHLCPVRLSKVMGLMNCVAFCVISTSTSQCCFNSIRATLAILYAAILPEIARTTVFPFSIVVSFCLIYQKYFKTVLLKYHKCIFYANITFLFVRDMI